MESVNLNIEESIYIKINKYEIQNPRARIVITHGILEHSGRYEHVAREFNRAGFDVFTYDLRGHGLSGGARGYIDSFAKFVFDLNLVLERISSDSSVIPTFLVGHSMGGLITHLHSIQNKLPPNIVGYVLMSPALSKPPLTMAENILAFFAPLVRMIAPYKTEKVNILSEKLMTDEGLQKQHREDPLVQDICTISLLVEVLKEAKKASKPPIASLLPTLILQGDKDTIVNWIGNIEVYEKLKAQNSKIEYEVILGEKHELFNSILKTREYVFSKIIRFLDKQLDRSDHKNESEN